MINFIKKKNKNNKLCQKKNRNDKSMIELL